MDNARRLVFVATKNNAVKLVVGLLVLSWGAPFARCQDACAEFNRLASRVYDFRPEQLKGTTAVRKEKELDAFWATVTKKRQQYLPCLRAAVADPKANPYLRFDCSNLLVRLDPSSASKRLLIQTYLTVDIKLANPRRWLLTMTNLGTEGFDVSAAGERWMKDKNADYYVPEHGDYHMNNFVGSLCIFGSMDEKYATPVLARIAATPKHPGRYSAIAILCDQYTDEAEAALKKLETSDLDAGWKSRIKRHLDEPVVLEARNPPLISRQEYLTAFQAFLKGDSSKFSSLVDRVQDGEHDAVAVLNAGDLPLIRRVRRLFISNDNPHAYSYYNDFTSIIATIYLRDVAGKAPI
jgi:hypothetical protein